MRPFVMHSSHSVSRLLFGSGLLFSVVITASMLWYVLLLLLSIGLIRVLDGHWLTTIRLLRLMRWFLVPILILHALLSPGQLLLPELLIPISREGLMQGIRLSLHLSAVFFVAMLMFRLLRRAEWLHYILLIPGLGQRLAVYVWMMNSMKMNITILLADLRMQFRIRRDLKRSVLLLMAAFQHSLADASDHAAMLWLRWPTQSLLGVAGDNNSHSVRYYIVSMMLAVLGCVAFLQVWM